MTLTWICEQSPSKSYKFHWNWLSLLLLLTTLAVLNHRSLLCSRCNSETEGASSSIRTYGQSTASQSSLLQNSYVLQTSFQIAQVQCTYFDRFTLCYEWMCFLRFIYKIVLQFKIFLTLVDSLLPSSPTCSPNSWIMNGTYFFVWFSIFAGLSSLLVDWLLLTWQTWFCIF